MKDKAARKNGVRLTLHGERFLFFFPGGLSTQRSAGICGVSSSVFDFSQEARRMCCLLPALC